MNNASNTHSMIHGAMYVSLLKWIECEKSNMVVLKEL